MSLNLDPGPAIGGDVQRESGAGSIRAAIGERLRLSETKLPLLPEAASQVLAATHDESVDVNRLVALLNRDPSLTAHVLRIANSPAYLPRTPIVSLQQAVTRLGIRAVGEMAMVAALQHRTFLAPGHEAELRAIWRHAAASGAYGREIARMLRSNVESAFLCGLLHTVGKPVVLQAALDIAADLQVRPTTADLVELMEDLHAPAGRLLALSWRLPKAVVDSIGRLDDYQATETPEPMITHLADRLASHLLDPNDDASALREHVVLADLNLYPEDLEALLEKHDAVLSMVQALAS